LLAHGQGFFPGTSDSSITKTGRHDIAKILLKVALYTINQPTVNTYIHCQLMLFWYVVLYMFYSLRSFNMTLTYIFHIKLKIFSVWSQYDFDKKIFYQNVVALYNFRTHDIPHSTRTH
jgi:hypothetical protein